MKDRLRTALIRAADWLEANPDRHIQGRLAADEFGTPCTVDAPRAECFCAVGRVAREYGLSGTTSVYTNLDDAFKQAGADRGSVDIFHTNDHGVIGDRRMVCRRVNPGNRRVIKMLRRIAERIKE